MTDTVANPQSAARAGAGAVALAAVIDVAIVAFFAFYGRASHGMTLVFAEFWRVAWPFLVGLAVAWILSLAWKRPLAPLRTGAPVTVITVVVGMVMRYAVEQQGQAPVSWIFVLIASGLLALLFIGWRGIATLIQRRRTR